MDQHGLSYRHHKSSLSNSTKQSSLCHTAITCGFGTRWATRIGSTVVDTTTDDPHILSLPLGSNTPTENWDVTLERGTHPSDPAGSVGRSKLCRFSDDNR